MLGRCSEAIQEGKRACEILPYTKDSWIGPTFMTYLAAIYAMCGEKEAALQQLKTSAELPVGAHIWRVKTKSGLGQLARRPAFRKNRRLARPKGTAQVEEG